MGVHPWRSRLSEKPRRNNDDNLQTWAHWGTIATSVVATVAFAFGSYQFYVTQEAQRDALELQQAALVSERHAKAGEFFNRFVELRMAPYVKRPKEEADEHRFVSAQKALALLNSIHNTTYGDRDWERVVYWSIQNYYPIRWSMKEGKVMCLALTQEFREMVERTAEDPKQRICNDVYDSN